MGATEQSHGQQCATSGCILYSGISSSISMSAVTQWQKDNSLHATAVAWSNGMGAAEQSHAAAARVQQGSVHGNKHECSHPVA